MRAPSAKSTRRAAPPAARVPGAARARTPPAATRDTVRDILAIATEEFAAKGLAGARVDEIAARMATSKRTIYYHFGGKEGLYVAVLEDAYRRMRESEAALDVDHLPPEAALRRLVEFTFDYQRAHPDFVRLVMNENIHRGEYLRRSGVIRRLNVPAIDAVRGICERGVAQGMFRPGLDAVDLHMTISALSFFNVSNRHTFSLIFRRDTSSARAAARRRECVVETVIRYVRAC